LARTFPSVIGLSYTCRKTFSRTWLA
jgi:hypothetical protein